MKSKGRLNLERPRRWVVRLRSGLRLRESKNGKRSEFRHRLGLEGGKPRYDGGMRIELITTGSELLLGQVLNSHPGYLSGRLALS